jgi:mono/diheme cytochrome c family protein
MSTPTVTPAARYTLRDLPLPAKLVLTTFLISVGIGYLWAMAQIHFKHASTGEMMPTLADLVARFSGVPWPLEPKPDPAEEEKKKDVEDKAAIGRGQQVFAVKIKSVLNERCAFCHRPGKDKADKPLDTFDGLSKVLTKSPQYPNTRLHSVIVGLPARAKRDFDSKDMSEAFFSESADWPDDEAKQKAERPGREAERQAVLAWVQAGAPKDAYEKDAFPLPPDKFGEVTQRFRTTAAAPASVAPEGAPMSAAERWAHAKSRRLTVDALTQSTHAHLLTFSILWAATGLIFAFTSYPCAVRSLLAPLVLVAQVADVACWWLARLDPPAGPYFALAILGTGTAVGIGLGAQIVLSIWNMYGRAGKAVVVLLFLLGAGLFGLTYVKVIHPQIQEERDFVAKQQQAK